ncbi:hypothetical protein ACFE04_006781 [Oxalis oulophora]
MANSVSMLIILLLLCFTTIHAMISNQPPQSATTTTTTTIASSPSPISQHFISPSLQSPTSPFFLPQQPPISAAAPPSLSIPPSSPLQEPDDTLSSDSPTQATSSSSAMTQGQLMNIFEALIGAGGDFNSWSNTISSVAASLPLSATIFLPADDSFFHTSVDPYIFPYHIVPQRLDFSQLRLLSPRYRLPTLVPGKTILITSNSAANFTLDDTVLSHPDLYTTPAIVVHGISTLFDYKTYGDNVVHPPPSPLSHHNNHHHHRRSPTTGVMPSPPPMEEGSSDGDDDRVPIPGTFYPPGDMMPRGEVIGESSDASSFDYLFVIAVTAITALCGAVILFLASLFQY